MKYTYICYSDYFQIFLTSNNISTLYKISLDVLKDHLNDKDFTYLKSLSKDADVNVFDKLISIINTNYNTYFNSIIEDLKTINHGVLQ